VSVSADPPPRRRFPRPTGLRSPRDELAEETAHGHVYLRGLRRAQLSLSLLALTTFGAIFGVLPAVLTLRPVQRVHLLGVPLGMWVVVVPMLPVFVAIGWLYRRRADALDEAFRELVER
jgi:putative solute:sodium symporter small subunit